MEEIEKYADQWDASARYFYEKDYYAWMAQKLIDYSTVVELGCGTGYSTLALAEKGFKVLAVDKNTACITKAKELIRNKGITGNQVIFIEGDITDEGFRKKLTAYSYDVGTCWNIGSYWNREMMTHYLPRMLKYGLDIQQIQEYPESSYAELILWEACELAKSKNVPVHIVERSTQIINEESDPYYFWLKNEIGYADIVYDNLSADSISDGGSILTANRNVYRSKKVDVIFASLLIR